MSNLLFDRISQRASSLFVTTIIGVLALNSIPTTTLAKPIKIGTAMTFDFKGCTKTSGGQDIICVGNFRNRDADKRISVGRKSSFITDFAGKSYVPDELRISDQLCRSNCLHQYITLVEGVDYKASFLFKDVSLSSPKIALFQINPYYSGSGYDPIKIRRINVSSSRAEDTNENSTSSLSDEQELQNTVNEVEQQDRQRIAAAQAEQQKKDREALARKQKQSGYTSTKPAPRSWLEQQVEQGILDLFGKPRKPGKK